MDKRGFTSDPNGDPYAKQQWWQTIGSTRGPSPYATKAWAYLQDWVETRVEIPASAAVVYDNGTHFNIPNYPTVWDGGLFNPMVAPSITLDS